MSYGRSFISHLQRHYNSYKIIPILVYEAPLPNDGLTLAQACIYSETQNEVEVSNENPPHIHTCIIWQYDQFLLLLIEMKNSLAVASSETTPCKDTKTSEISNLMHAQLFSNIIRMGIAEQLCRGKLTFANLLDQIPVEL